MAKDWDYADMAHQAKNNGGPQKYMSIVKKHSYEKGVKDGQNSTLPLVAAAFAVGFIIDKIPKAYRFIRSKFKKNTISDEVAQEAETELLRGMETANCAEGNECPTAIESESLKDEGPSVPEEKLC